MSQAAAQECLNFNLRKADRAFSQIYDKALAPSGLKATQFSVLNAVSLRSEVSISALAQAMVMDRTTLTRNLAPLVREGLVEVVPGSDRRTRMVDLQPEGRRRLHKALPLWQRTQQRLEKHLGTGTTRQLLEQLQAAVNIAEKL